MNDWKKIDRLTELARDRLREMDRLDDQQVMELIEDMVFDEGNGMNISQIEFAIEAVFYRLRSPIGYLARYLEDDDVNEIMVNGYDRAYVEKSGRIVRVDSGFSSVEELNEVIRGIGADVHREINEMNPILDGRLADGSRVNAVYRNVALNGPALTIRKFRNRFINRDVLVENGSVTEECLQFLEALVTSGYNIFVSGGTSSGKTTFLNVLSEFIPEDSRVVVIEDSAELQLRKVHNMVSMECRNANSLGKGLIDMDMLIKTSLRMRPDVIIVGEVRGREVSSMLQALNTGHTGMSTGHGNSVEGMLRRMEAMYLMGSQIPVEAIRSQITEAIDVMVHLGRLKNGQRRVLEVDELTGYENGRYCLNRIFTTDFEMGRPVLRNTGNRIKRREKLMLRGEEHGLQNL